MLSEILSVLLANRALEGRFSVGIRISPQSVVYCTCAPIPQLAKAARVSNPLQDGIQDGILPHSQADLFSAGYLRLNFFIL